MTRLCACALVHDQAAALDAIRCDGLQHRAGVCAPSCGSDSSQPRRCGKPGRAGIRQRQFLHISGWAAVVQEWVGAGARDLGRWWSQEDGSLELTGRGQSSGVNNVGPFTSYYYEWQATGGASNLALTTMVSVYETVPAVLFVLVFKDKATNTNISNNVNGTLSTFPSFVIEEGPVERGYVTWSGNSE